MTTPEKHIPVRANFRLGITVYPIESMGLKCRNGLQPVAEIISLDRNQQRARVGSL
jgi:hypothetical protein